MKPELTTDFSVRALRDGIFNIDAPPLHFQCYLVIGAERALLIDTGLGFGSLKKVVERLTDLPVVVVNTHGHPDHCGGNAEFSDCRMNPADLELFRAKCTHESRTAELSRMLAGAADMLLATPADPQPVGDGEIIDLGGRRLQILYTPGHTGGSVCVFDDATGALFAGDNLQAGATALLEPAAVSVKEYLQTLKRLMALQVQTVYAGHLPCEVAPGCIPAKADCAERICAGETGDYMETPRGRGYVVSSGATAIHYAPEKNCK